MAIALLQRLGQLGHGGGRFSGDANVTPGDLILGGGMTGLAMGLVSGLPVYEREDSPGGICSSYYTFPGDKTRFSVGRHDGEAYRFERGGGHWIFGGDPFVLRFIGRVVELRSYVRDSAVYFPELQLRVPYPIQNHLRYLGPDIASKALSEMVEARQHTAPVETMADWLRTNFGPTLGRLFFEPFHELYTGGLWRQIVPQDAYKSPINLSVAARGALQDAPAAGYNVTFAYPVEGLNTLARRMAERCAIHYGRRVVRIDTSAKSVHFEDGSTVQYRTVLSTLPLNRALALSGLVIDERADPSVSVLVINIGARRGTHCPSEHWVYVPTSRAGFHRVGFYSNVDASFVPQSSRVDGERVGIYVEKAYRDGCRPPSEDVGALCDDVIRELQEWHWIGDVEAVDSTWIDVAYTWSWPGSRWRERALGVLESRDIYQVGRFARWTFQGIADSIRDGLLVGATWAATGDPGRQGRP